MPLTLITAPAAEPITLAEAKAHVRRDDTAEDALITALIQAAREQAEHITGRALITQTWELALDAFPAAEIALARVPVASITNVKYDDAAGVEQTLSPTLYTLDATGIAAWLLPAYGTEWPATRDNANAVRIRFQAGYGASGASVPQSIRQWMLVQIGYWYANREAAADRKFERLPFVDCLLDPYRTWTAI